MPVPRRFIHARDASERICFVRQNDSLVYSHFRFASRRCERGPLYFRDGLFSRIFARGKKEVMMKKKWVSRWGILLGCLLTWQALAARSAGDDNGLMEREKVMEVMRRVADWQMAHQGSTRHQPLGWENAAMYMGMMDLAGITGGTGSPYYRFVRSI
jgi:hypothetical protein